MSRLTSDSQPDSLTIVLRRRTSSWARVLASCGCLLLFAWACFNWFSLLHRDIEDFAPIPEWDYWETVAHIPRYEASDISVLWEQRYEHRAVFAEMVYGADYLFFHGRQILPAVLNVVLYGATLVLFAFIIWRASGIPRYAAFAAVCMVAVILAFPGATFSLSLPILVHFFMSQLAVAGALWLLARGNLFGAIAAAVVATFSLSNGLGLWPILIFFACLRRESFRRIGILAGAFVLTAAAFFTGYRDLGNFNPVRAFSRPTYVAAYFLRYVSMPFGAMVPSIGVIVGSCSVLALFVLFAIAWRKQLLTEPVAVVGFGVGFLVIFTVAMTSMGRVPFLKTWQDSSIIPGHYMTVSLGFWSALVMLTVFVLCRTFSSPLPAAIFLSLFAAGAALQQMNMSPWTHNWLKTPAMYRFASLALESGVKTDLAYGILYYPDPQLVPRSLPALANRHLSIYSYPRNGWIGRPASSQFGLSSGGQESRQITSVTPIPSGFLTAGWAAGNWSELVLLDRDRTIIGLGERFSAEWPDLAPIAKGHEGQGWIAFSQTPPAEACVLSGDRRSAVCFASK